MSLKLNESIEVNIPEIIIRDKIIKYSRIYISSLLLFVEAILIFM